MVCLADSAQGEHTVRNMKISTAVRSHQAHLVITDVFAMRGYKVDPEWWGPKGPAPSGDSLDGEAGPDANKGNYSWVTGKTFAELQETQRADPQLAEVIRWKEPGNCQSERMWHIKIGRLNPTGLSGINSTWLRSPLPTLDHGDDGGGDLATVGPM